MKSYRMLFVIFMLLLFSVSIGWATTIHVQEDYPTIQEGIDNAANGDTVLVERGTYWGVLNHDISFFGKAIVVIGVDGPDVTIIDCMWEGSGFAFSMGEDESSKLEGFTIRYATGYGIYCSGSSPTITECILLMNGEGFGIIDSSPAVSNCTISGNPDGRGVYLSNSDAILSGCTIEGNTKDSYGGGIYCGLYSNPTITDCTIEGNSAERGGGIYCSSSSPTISDCMISGNTASNDYDGDGGGIYCYYSSLTITNCIISGNMADNDGGGIFCRDFSSPTITKCTFTGNSAYNWGGGIGCNNYSSPSISNCIFTGNYGSYGGGGISCYSNDSPSITHCTLTGNSGGSRSGGVSCYFSSFPTITNCILWNDTPEEIYVYEDSDSDPVVTYSDIQGGWEGEGNIDVDPLFFNPDNDDYHLSIDSPCIDTGIGTSVTDDFEGDARPWGDWFDIGADEYTEGQTEGLVIEVMFYPIWIAPGDVLSWKIRATNFGDDSVDVDEVRLEVTGPASVIKTLWSGSVGLPPDYQIETWFDLDVPLFAPLGTYTCTTIASFEGEDLAEDGFECEVVD